MWEPLVAAASRHHRKAAGAGPVHQVTDERGLVAKGQGIDTACFGCAPGENGATECVGLYRDIDHVLALFEGCQDVVDCGDGVSGALNHDIDLGVPDELLPVIGEVGLSAHNGLINGAGLCLLVGPADPGEIFSGCVG